MLSIARLRVGSEAYQLTGVAQSLNAYYSGEGEAAGWWAGVGAGRLELSGEVAGDDLRAVLAGIDPRAGGLSPNGETIKPHPRRVPGFDLTFKAPKSVSTLYAVTDDPRVQGAIIEAYEAALRDTIAWLERDAVAVRRGTGNAKFLADLAAVDPDAAAAAKQRVVGGGESITAVFRHRTSRAGDPLLHWHTLMANLVRGSDGRWSAFVHPDLFRSARAAGEVFQAAGRERLTHALGVEWRPGRHVPEIVGVPQGLMDRFSKRSQQIEAYLAATGLPDDAAGRQEAVLATRRGKDELEGERFDGVWKAEAVDYGWGPEQAEALLASAPSRAVDAATEPWRLPERSVDEHGSSYDHDRVVTAEEWVSDLLRRDLTVSDATFSPVQVVQAVAHRLGDGASVSTIERITARVLSSPQVLPVADDTTVRYTSTEMAAVEHRLLDAFDRRDPRAPVPAEVVDAALVSRPTLGADQVEAVRRLVTTTDPVSVLVGPAGTGKTFAFDVVRDAFEHAGFRVVGAAPSARAAIELETSGIESSTLQSLQGRWSSGIDWPDARTVVVIDEAGMSSSRDLEPIVTRAVNAGARVILSGDPHQLPEIEAGGALAAAVVTSRPDPFAAEQSRVGTVAELNVNRRQRGADQEWERTALADLRNGSVPAAVAAYRRQGRVIPTDDVPAMLGEAVRQWFAARDAGNDPVLMAGTNETVRLLNLAVRDELIRRNQLATAPIAVVGGVEMRVGDRVVLRQNWWHDRPGHRIRARLVNGQGATVTGGDDNGLEVRRDGDDRPVVLGADYLRRGAVELGYAITTHRAQGGSWDIGIGVGLDGLYREAAYVQLSRARHRNLLILTEPELATVDAELERHDLGIPLPGEEIVDLETELNERLAISHGKQMAHSRDPHLDRIGELARTMTLPEIETRLVHIHAVQRAATSTINVDPIVLERAITRAQYTAEHLAVGQRVKAHDRHNIGTVVGLDDPTGAALVQFRAASGAERIRRLHWTLLDIDDPDPPQRELPPSAQNHLDRLVRDAGNSIRTWQTNLEDHGVGLLEGRHLERARELIVDRNAASLGAHRPDWLDDLLGARPEQPHAAHAWDEAVSEIATVRARSDLPADIAGIGNRPTDPDHQRTWDQASQHLLETRIHLDGSQRPIDDQLWPRRRTPDDLQSRCAELEAILADAPDDQRKLIERLRAGDPVNPAEVSRALQDAVQAQGSRRAWILAHWPHVIEYVQVTNALAGAAPDDRFERLLDRTTEEMDEPLHRAVERRDPWVDRVLPTLEPQADGGIGPHGMRVLREIASYRKRWGVTDDVVLGFAPPDPTQAGEHARVAQLVAGVPSRDRSLGRDSLPANDMVASTGPEQFI